MSCNIDLIITSVVLNYLNKVDKDIGTLFQKKTNALSLAKGSPVIEDIFNHFVQTNSKSRKIKFNAIEDAEQSTSDDENVEEINLTTTNPFNPIKIEVNAFDGSLSEIEERSSKKSDSVHTQKSPFSEDITASDQQQISEPQSLDNNAAPEFYIDPNPTENQLHQIRINDFSGNALSYDESNVGSSYDNNYYDYNRPHHHQYQQRSRPQNQPKSHKHKHNYHTRNFYTKPNKNTRKGKSKPTKKRFNN